MIKCDEIDNSLKYFRDNGINAKNTAMKNDFADFIGHSTVEEIAAYYYDREREKKDTLIWAVANICGPETTAEICKKIASVATTKAAQVIIDGLNKDLDEAEAKRITEAGHYGAMEAALAAKTKEAEGLREQWHDAIETTEAAEKKLAEYMKGVLSYKLENNDIWDLTADEREYVKSKL